jgi:hypothetical protein
MSNKEGEFMGIFDSLFGRKKKTLKMAIDAVDFVKIGLLYYLLPECKANFDNDYSEVLGPAVINTIFSEIPSNEEGIDFIKNQTNIKNINIVIANSIIPVDKLKQIITDAVRVKCIVTYELNKNLSDGEFEKQCREPINLIKKLHILQKGGETPGLGNFIISASNFLKACKKDYELNVNS